MTPNCAPIDRPEPAFANPGTSPHRLLNVDQAAEYLGMTVCALRHKAVRGKIPVTRIDTRLRFDLHDLDACIDQGKR